MKFLGLFALTVVGTVLAHDGDGGSHNGGSHEATPHEVAAHEAGSHEAAAHEAGSHQAAAHEAGSLEAGSLEAAAHEAGSHEAASHEAATHGAGSHEAASHQGGLHGGHLVSAEMQCRQLAKLGRLVELSKNQTLLNEDTEGDKAEMDAIKAQAADADHKLQELQKNTTLVHECAVIGAQEVMKERCAKRHRLEELAALVNNQTALDVRTHNNASRAQALKDRVQAEAAELKELATNSTLTRFCAANELKQTCTRLAQWQKQVEQATNATAVAAKFGGEEDLLTEFRIKIKMAQGKLAEAMKNASLVEGCKELGMGIETGKNGLADVGKNETGKMGEESKSDAIVTHPAGAMLSLVIVLFASVLLL